MGLVRERPTIQIVRRVKQGWDGQQLSVLFTLPGPAGKCHVGQWGPRMAHKPGSPREFSASLENRAALDRQRSRRAAWQYQPQQPLPSSPPPLVRGLASPAASLPAQPPCPAPRAQPRGRNCPGNCSQAAGVQSHRLATLGEEILWLGLNKLVQLLEALWLLVA